MKRPTTRELEAISHAQRVELWRDITVRARNAADYQNTRLFNRLIKVMKAKKEV